MALFGVGFYIKDVQEVQLHDSYFVFDPFEFAFVTVGPVLFLSFLVRGIRTKFKERLTRIFFGLGIAIVALVVVEIYEITGSLQEFGGGTTT